MNEYGLLCLDCNRRTLRFFSAWLGHRCPFCHSTNWEIVR